MSAGDYSPHFSKVGRVTVDYRNTGSTDPSRVVFSMKWEYVRIS